MDRFSLYFGLLFIVINSILMYVSIIESSSIGCIMSFVGIWVSSTLCFMYKKEG